MKRLFIYTLAFFTLLFSFFTPSWAQRKKINRFVPAGDYSGITHIKDNLYAVVDDKSEKDGFYLWNIFIDSKKGKPVNIENLGFIATPNPNRDAEGIAYLPHRNTLLIAGEKDNRIIEYTLEGQPTGRQSIPLLSKRGNLGIEGLCYDSLTHTVYAIEENNGADSCHLFLLDDNLQLTDTKIYPLDPPSAKPKKKGSHIYGASEILAYDGNLCVLEREVRIPKNKIGAWARTKIFTYIPVEGRKVSKLFDKKTRLNLTSRRFANFEGMCFGPTLDDGTPTLILISDSQHRYKGVLRDWLQIAPSSSPEGEGKWK